MSYHEVGHALVTALSKNAEPVQKITIVPRTMGSLGYTMQVPEEEKYLMSKEELMTRVYDSSWRPCGRGDCVRFSDNRSV